MKLERWTLRATCLAGTLALLMVVPAAAQDESQPPEGVNSGNYNIQQSLEAGYRYTNFTGSRDVYNTYVNLNPGFRLFDHTLHMRSLNHNGLLFDDFLISSFGYGGDPNDVTRVRVYKNKWYNLSGSFRRDRNFWDYNLLANPINPVNTAPFPTLQLGFSPHSFQTTRRMSDFNLVVLPQSRVRFRAGYGHSVSEGPTFSTVHEGTEPLLLQDWRTTIDSYHFGADFKLLPRTNFSYDQFLESFKGDTTWQDLPVLPFAFSSGAPVDLGIVFNSVARQPCATPLIANPTPPPALVANPACNNYQGYTRAGRPRNFFPTEQFSFQSSYFHNVDMSGRLIYSSSDIFSSDFNELFAGLISRTNQNSFANFGPAETKRVSVTADWAATLRVTDKFRVVDTFRYNTFRLPGQWVFLQLAGFPVSGTPPQPQHNASSPADFLTGRSERFLGQNVKYNTFELEYDFTKRLGARIGYRYGNRHIVDRATQITDTEIFLTGGTGVTGGIGGQQRGDCSVVANCTPGPVPNSLMFSNANQPIANLTVVEPSTTINEHSLLLGLKARPMDTLRISYDMEVFFADDAFTRISPRQLQHYEVRATYKPKNWMTFATSVNIIENRDNVVNINNLQHNRSYGLNAAFAPNDRFGIDFGWDYNDIFSQINICYVSSTAPRGSTVCPGPAGLVQALSFYTNTTHYGYGDIMWKPIKRVTATLGYAGSAVNGNTLILSPNAPVGPLQFNFHRPYGGFAVDLLKGLTWKADWRYYGYNEKAEPSFTTLPTGRDFRGNMVTIGFRYAF